MSIYDFNKYNEYINNLDMRVIKRMLEYKIEIAFSFEWENLTLFSFKKIQILQNKG